MGTASELAWAALPWAPAPRPSGAADVTAGWLTEAFQRHAPGAVAIHVETAGGTTGTTDRQRLRVEWNEDGRAAGLPETVFVKSTPLSAKNRLMVASLQMAVNEVRFYEDIRPRLADDVAPRSWAGHAGKGARHLLVLEDLADAHCWALAEECDLDHARGIMVALGTLHAAFWNQGPDWVPTQTHRPGIDLLRWQFRRVRTKIVKTRDDITDTVRRMTELCNEHDEALYGVWERPPITLLHGDSHLGNTYTRSGSAGLLDWQVIHRGPGMREVAYFLGHSVPTELRRANEEDLVRLYLDTLGDHGVDSPDFGAAWLDYRFFLFDAWDSTAITLLWPGLQEPENTRRAFARATAAVTDHATDEAIEAVLR